MPRAAAPNTHGAERRAAPYVRRPAQPFFFAMPRAHIAGNNIHHQAAAAAQPEGGHMLADVGIALQKLRTGAAAQDAVIGAYGNAVDKEGHERLARMVNAVVVSHEQMVHETLAQKRTTENLETSLASARRKITRMEKREEKRLEELEEEEPEEEQAPAAAAPARASWRNILW